jgi:hypothetical protein
MYIIKIHHYFTNLRNTANAAFLPQAPITPPPGCVPAEHKNKFLYGVA